MDCVFCDIAAGRAEAAKVYEDDDTLAFMDHAPLNEGHALVIPKRHAGDIFDIEPGQAMATMRTAVKVANALKGAYGCDGVNLLQSNGRAAGQSVFHFHIHVVPRWSGDRAIALQRQPGASQTPLTRVAEKIRCAIDAAE